MGISLSEYNEMTPHELNLFIEGYAEKERNKHENELLVAYMGAYFNRVERLETFDYYQSKMEKQENKKMMTDEEMLESIKKLNSLIGGNTVQQ